MRKTTSLLTFMALTFLFVSNVYASIRYTNGNLLIVTKNPTSGTTTVTPDNKKGVYLVNMYELNWMYNGYSKLKIDVDGYAAIAGYQDRILFYNTTKDTYNNIVVGSVFNQSDSRAKKNVSNIQSGLMSLLQLRPVSYRWADKPANKVSAIDDTIQMPSDPQDRLQYGFIAQEVEEILPDLVLTDDNGSKSVNYIAMIPLLVQSVKELQSTVEKQAMVIEQLQGAVAYKSKAEYAGNKIKSVSPNPTTGNFSVELQLSNASAEVFLTISDMGGNKQQIIEVNYAQGIVSVDASSLPQGVFILSLYINNMLADSCRLIKE